MSACLTFFAGYSISKSISLIYQKLKYPIDKMAEIVFKLRMPSHIFLCSFWRSLVLAMFLPLEICIHAGFQLGKTY